jgi:hypothetical protein
MQSAFQHGSNGTQLTVLLVGSSLLTRVLAASQSREGKSKLEVLVDHQVRPTVDAGLEFEAGAHIFPIPGHSDYSRWWRALSSPS